MAGEKDKSDEILVCRCFEVTERTIRDAIRQGNLRTVEEVRERTKASGGCGSCYEEVREILDEVYGAPPKEKHATVRSLPRGEKWNRIRDLLKGDLGLLIEANGIRAELVEVHANQAHIRFHGPGMAGPGSGFLSIKRHLVTRMTEVCQEPMVLVELNVVEKHGGRTRIRVAPPQPGSAGS